MTVEGWGDFYLASAGTAATLAGLLFVALSVNKDPIGGDHEYRSLARQTVSALMSIVVLALFALIPKQPSWLFGLELAVGALTNLVSSFLIQVKTFHRIRTDPRRYMLSIASYDVALLLVIVAAAAQYKGWMWTPMILVVSVLMLGAVAMANCWTLVMRVNTPTPTEQTKTASASHRSKVGRRS